tara:strand:- start:1038 stop:1421 length:384 start_codon:yes stop_codon:yes gene_type:complete
MKYIILTSLLFMTVSGCKIAPVKHYASNDCCSRLDVRTKEMQEFNRYCKVLVFAAKTEKDPKTKKGVTERIGICKFVFGVKTNAELLSAGPDESYYKVRHYLITNPDENGFPTVLDCDPNQPACEEF